MGNCCRNAATLPSGTRSCIAGILVDEPYSAGNSRSTLVGSRLVLPAALTGVILVVTFFVGRMLQPQVGLSTPTPNPAQCHSTAPVLHTTEDSPRPPQIGFRSQLVYDGASCRLLLFGPCCLKTNDPQVAETWVWDGRMWGRLQPATSPPALIGAAIAYDPDTRSVLMFGGIEDRVGRVAETWSWKDGSWTQLHPAHSPSPRDGASAVYDEAHHEVLLFGGNTDGTPGSNDTWTWDGTDWQLERPAASPEPKVRAGLAYDRAHRVVVLFGGFTPDVETSDTWIWTGATWIRQQPLLSPPSHSDLADIGYDANSGKVVLVLSREYASQETWTWDGTMWTQEHPATSLPNRSSWELAYDDAIHRLVLFESWGADGTAYGQTSMWLWTGTDWKAA
jgi:Kelch motif